MGGGREELSFSLLLTPKLAQVDFRSGELGLTDTVQYCNALYCSRLPALERRTTIRPLLRYLHLIISHHSVRVSPSTDRGRWETGLFQLDQNCFSFIVSYFSMNCISAISPINCLPVFVGPVTAMSAKNENGACSNPEPSQQKLGQDKKANQPAAGLCDESSQKGQAKGDSSGENTGDAAKQHPLTLQDLIDFTNESP